MPKLFGTSGIRGPAETLFSKEFCHKLGTVFGAWLKQKGKSGWVAVAMDPRDSSPRIKEGIMAGLATQGWEILDEGVIPTPALTYFVKSTPHVGGGVMVTGSHITANLNGVKLFIDGEEVDKRAEVEIENLFAQFEFKSQTSHPIVKREQAAQELYVEMVTNLADLPYPKWKVVLDTANGTQSEVMRQVILNLNLDLYCTDYCDIQSPHFVPRDTESSAGMGEIIRDVLTHQADLAVILDVDGDRVVFVDNTGRLLPGDYSCSLLAQAQPAAKIVTPISTSSVVDQLGKKVYRTPVGSTWVAAKMKEVGAGFGFEPNGGAIFAANFYGRDGAATFIALLNLLKESRQSLAQLYTSLPQYFLFKDKVDCPPDLYESVYQAARDKYADKSINDMDGVKVDLGADDWILFRASGNAPEFRVFVQSKDRSRAEKLGAENLAWVRQLIHKPSVAAAAVVVDSLGIADSIRQLPDQFRQVMSEISLQEVPHECLLADQIVLAGMGGSALGGRIIQSLEQQILQVPLTISTEFYLPNFVDEKTLVVVSSYSGNTAEAISSFEDALRRKAKVHVLTSGGKLAHLAKQKNIPAYVFAPRFNPSGQPRMGLGYSLAALLFLLARCQFLSSADALTAIPDFLQGITGDAQKQGQQLAAQLAGRAVILMAAQHLKGPAHAVKNMLNENSKNMAYFFDLPEADHHLLEGLAYPVTNFQNLVAIMLNSRLYDPRVSQRNRMTAQIFAKQRIKVADFPSFGQNRLQEAVAAILVGEWLSYYLAAYNRVDPGPLPWVDYLKDQL